MNINWKVAANEKPVIFYRTTKWNSLKLVHWQVHAGQLAETIFDHHEISLPMQGGFTTTRQTASGWQRVQNRAQGNMCLVPSGQPVSIDWTDQAECLTLAIEPALITRVAHDFTSVNKLELKEVYDKNDPLIWQIGLALLRESQSVAPVGRLYAEALTQSLAVHLFRHYTVQGERRELNEVGGLTGRKLRLATEFINANLSDDLTLAEIAKVVNLSPYHFARAFKRTTGKTPQQYLTERRVRRAKELLAQPNLPLVEISAQVGFKNQSHFTTFFRRYTAMTPKVWRNTHFA